MEGNWRRDIAVIAGGVAVGVIGSRLLAPVMASASGTVRARLGADPFDRLIQDHEEIKSILHEMEMIGTDSPGQRMKLFLALKRTLAKHAMAEEDVVYPQLHAAADAGGDSKQLYDEHADMKIHLYELEQLVTMNLDWSYRVSQLRTLIESHVQQEEQVEFPRLRRALNEHATNALAAHIHREEALVL